MGEILGVVGLVVLAAVYVGLGLADHDDACGTCSFGQDSPRCGTCPEAGATPAAPDGWTSEVRR